MFLGQARAGWNERLQYLSANGIFFGGGTRIALELDEFRESVGIDFLCADAESYRAVRSQVSSNSLGNLLKSDSALEFARQIRADRDAVRTFVLLGGNKPIKLEFIRFDDYGLGKQSTPLLGSIPCIDHDSCFMTKLLTNADRYSDPNKKDIVDLCVMAKF
jgi:hypothetical protein